jgi:PAS domain S-box-containing protein
MDLLECQGDDLLKLTIPDIMYEPDLQRGLNNFQLVVTEGFTEGEFRLKKMDGSVIWVMLRAVRLSDERFMAFCQDISSRKSVEADLQTSQARLNGIINSAMDAIVTVDDNQRIILFNTAAEKMFAYPANQVIGQPLSLLMPERFQISHIDSFSSFEESNHPGSTDRAMGTITGMRSSGEEFPVEASLSIVETNGIKLFTAILRDVTARKESEAVVLNSERKYRELFENATVGMYRTSLDNPVILEVNTHIGELLEMRKEEIIGKDASIFFADPADWMHINDLLMVQDRVNNFEARINTRSGIKICLFSVTAYPEENLLEGTLLDITARQQAETALRRRSGELELLLEAGRELSTSFYMKEVFAILYRYVARCVPMDMLIVSSFDPVLELIQCEYMGGPDGEIDSSAFPPIPLEPESMGTQSLVIRSGMPLLLPDFETQRRTATTSYLFDEDGTFVDDPPADAERVRSAILVPLIVDGRVAGVLQVFSNQLNAHTTDHLRFVEALIFRVAAAMSNAALFQRLQTELDERRQAEENIRLLNANLEKRVLERTADLSRANTNLAQASRSKDDFLASMSHELRTPLSAILTLTESMQEGTYGTLSERMVKPVQIITESGQHLLNLINDILDISKIEAGKLEAQIATLDVETLCQSSLRLVRNQAFKKNQHIEFDFDPRVSVMQADPRLMKQMLVNLLINAIKFTHENGQIGLVVRGHPSENILKFTVWDTGIGIDTTHAHRLFQPFVQADSGLARQYGGTGLGLSLVYRMAELQGGGIYLESVPGEGSRFTVSMPWDEQEQAGRSSYSMEPASSSQPEISQPTPSGDERTTNAGMPLLLIVEDHPGIQTTYADFLTQHNFNIIFAGNGVEAIQRVHDSRPDLILMDVQLPGMDGLEVTNRLRASNDFHDISILILTALAMPGDRERCLASGADDYLTKPVQLNQLIETIQTHIRRKTP